MNIPVNKKYRGHVKREKYEAVVDKLGACIRELKKELEAEKAKNKGPFDHLLDEDNCFPFAY